VKLLFAQFYGILSYKHLIVLSEPEVWDRVCRYLLGLLMMDHRHLVKAMLWVMRGVSWREVPSDFVPWQTICIRYRQWCKAEIWSQIIQMFYDGETYSDAAQVLL